jgi:hypothetical protein
LTGNIIDTGALTIQTSGNGNITLSTDGTGIVNISGDASATGNITGNFFIGDGSALTGVTAQVSGNLAGNLLANGFFVNNLTELVVNGNITANAAPATANSIFSVGYLLVPQNDIGTAATYTIGFSDVAEHINSTATSTVTVTIPANATTALPIGTTVSLVMQGTGIMTVAPAVGVTLYFAGTSQVGSRQIGSYGMGSLMKVGTDTWFITGTGVN